MTDAHPNEIAIMSDTHEAGGTERVRMYVDVDVHDADRLRRIAADRMSRSGFDTDPAEHLGEPIEKMLWEAMVGSNPDPLSPMDMGFEIVGIARG